MRTLALETSDLPGSVAALEGRNFLLELTLPTSRRTTQSLIPTLKELLEKLAWQPRDVRLIGVSVGPGSFTGLRVGITVAKLLAYCLKADLVAVNTLEAIAAAAPEMPPEMPPEIVVVQEALRGDIVGQSFRRQSDGPPEQLGPQKLVAAESWLNSLTRGTVVSGPGLRRLARRLPPEVRLLPPETWQPRAGIVGRLAVDYHARGRRDDPWTLSPCYFRPSAAEEKMQNPGSQSS